MLKLERLESRDVPDGAPIDPVTVGFPELAEWGVPVYMMTGDLTGAEATGVRILDQIFYAGIGGAARVKVIDGGRGVYEPFVNEFGLPSMRPAGAGAVLFDGYVMGDMGFRGGLTGATTEHADGTAAAHFAWGGEPDGSLPGPVLASLTFNGTGFDVANVMALEETYRGVIALRETHLIMSPLDFGYSRFDDLLIAPGETAGNGPRVIGMDGATRAVVFDRFFADPDSRERFRLSPTLAGIQVDVKTREHGYGIDTRYDERTGEYMRTTVYTFAGRLVSVTDSEGEPWRLVLPPNS